MDDTKVASTMFKAELGITVKRAAHNGPQVAVEMFHV